MKFKYRIKNGLIKEDIMLTRVTHIHPVIAYDDGVMLNRTEDEAIKEFRDKHKITCFFNISLVAGTTISVDGQSVELLEKDRKNILKAINKNDKEYFKMKLKKRAYVIQ